MKDVAKVVAVSGTGFTASVVDWQGMAEWLQAVLKIALLGVSLGYAVWKWQRAIKKEKERKQAMRNLLMMGMAVLGLLVAPGCASNPGKFEESLFTVTNVPMLTVHTVTNQVTVTNVVTVPQTNVVQVIRTNEVGVVVPVYQTNVVEVQHTNVVKQEQVLPAGSTVLVPQFAGRTATGDGVVATGSGIAGLFGYGGIAGLVLSGLGNWWQRSRNQALTARYTGASEGQAIAQQTSTALVQNVETLLEVLQGTPQGQAALPAVKSYLMNHQLETGVISQVAGLLNSVDNEAARESAQEILKAVNTLKG